MFLSISTPGLINLLASSLRRNVVLSELSERDVELHKMTAFCCLVTLFIDVCPPSERCWVRRRRWRSERTSALILHCLGKLSGQNLANQGKIQSWRRRPSVRPRRRGGEGCLLVAARCRSCSLVRRRRRPPPTDGAVKMDEAKTESNLVSAAKNLEPRGGVAASPRKLFPSVRPSRVRGGSGERTPTPRRRRRGEKKERKERYRRKTGIGNRMRGVSWNSVGACVLSGINNPVQDSSSCSSLGRRQGRNSEAARATLLALVFQSGIGDEGDNSYC